MKSNLTDIFDEVTGLVVFLPPDFKTSCMLMACYALKDGRFVACHDLSAFVPPEDWVMKPKAQFEHERYAKFKQAYGLDPGDVYSLIRRGAALCIALDGSSAMCFDARTAEATQIPVDLAQWTLVFYKGVLCRAQEDDDPPAEKRGRHDGYKIGWRNAKLPGETHEIWRCIQ